MKVHEIVIYLLIIEKIELREKNFGEENEGANCTAENY